MLFDLRCSTLIAFSIPTFDLLVDPLEGLDVLEEGDAADGPDGLLHGEGLDLPDQPPQPRVAVLEAPPVHHAPDHVQARQVEEAGNGHHVARGLKVQRRPNLLRKKN